MVDVFISYSRANQPVVRQLAEAVKRLGYSVWWDDELPPHLSYSDVITDKIGSAKAAIVVWSEGAAALHPAYRRGHPGSPSPSSSRDDRPRRANRRSRRTGSG
jgi:hypothetical protein